MDTWLNYHHLYYFKTIATEGSISAASRKLRLGQPTLSAQLKQLEDRLGHPLFERSHRKLQLTETGRLALKYATEIFNLGTEMLEALQDRLPRHRTHVSVGALDGIPKSLLSRFVQEAYRAGPTSVSILEGKGDELLRELLQHRIDLLITNHPPLNSDAGRIYVKQISVNPVVVCGAPKYARLKKGFPQSLNGSPIILPTLHSKLRADLTQYFDENKITPDVVAETQDTSLQKVLGTQGVGLIAISRAAVHGLIKRRELIEIGKLSGVTEAIFLVSASRRIENPVSAKLWRIFSV